MAWLDADIGERGGEVDRLIEAPEDSVAPGEERRAILPMTLVCPHNHTMRTKTSELRQHTQLDWVNRVAKLCCERKQPAFIAVFASSMDGSKITRSIPEITFSDDAKRPNAFKDAKRQVTVFEIGPKAHNPAEFEIKPLAAPVADMDGVIAMLTARTNRFDGIGHYKLYAVGYDMFNGALTLSRAMKVDVFARDEDGVERIQPQTRTVLAAPQRILFAHTNTRSIDSIYQIVGRTYNDLHFPCPNFRIEILTGVSARGNLMAYAMAEDALMAATIVPAGYALQGESAADEPLEQLEDDLDQADEGVPMDYEDAAAAARRRPAVPERVRLPMHECVRSAHTAFANAAIVAKDENMQTYELSQLVLGRKRRTMASTIGGHAPITLEELRARGSHALALDDWEAPEEEDESTSRTATRSPKPTRTPRSCRSATKACWRARCPSSCSSSARAWRRSPRTAPASSTRCARRRATTRRSNPRSWSAPSSTTSTAACARACRASAATRTTSPPRTRTPSGSKAASTTRSSSRAARASRTRPPRSPSCAPCSRPSSKATSPAAPSSSRTARPRARPPSSSGSSRLTTTTLSACARVV